MQDAPSVIRGSGFIQALVVDPYWNAGHRWRQVLWGNPALNQAYYVRALPEARYWLSCRITFNLLVVDGGIIDHSNRPITVAQLQRFLGWARHAGNIRRIAVVLPPPNLTDMLPLPTRLNWVTDFVQPSDVLREVPKLVRELAA